MKWFKLDKRYTLIYLKLFFLSLLYIFPLILVNMYYEDDLARTLYGATGWKGDGRPLGEALVVWLCGGGKTPIIDIAPLSLILSMLVLVYALTLYAKSNWDSRFDDYMQIMVLLFVLLNPFSMSNLSYRFDCIIMFTALSISFLLYSIPATFSEIGISIVSFILSMIIMSLYQPAICMCIILCIVQIFLFVIGKREKIHMELYRIMGLGAGAVIYKLVIARHYVSKEDWRLEASYVVTGLQGIKIVFSNIVNTCRYIIANIKGTSFWNILVLIVLIAFAILSAMLLYCRENRQKNRIHKMIGIIFIIISPFIVFLATFFPLMFLESLGIRSRILLSFGGFLFFIGIVVLYSTNKYKVLGMTLFAICILYQYTFMYSYANALQSQNEYHKYMVYSIAHDLETINYDGEYSYVTIVGTMPKSRKSQLICNKYPLINEVVPVYINNSTWLGGAWLYSYLQDGLSLEAENDSDLKIISDGEPVLKNSIYSCYLNSEKIIIYFHE